MNASINKYVGEMIVSSNCGLPNYIFWEKYSVRRARIRRGIAHTKKKFSIKDFFGKCHIYWRNP